MNLPESLSGLGELQKLWDAADPGVTWTVTILTALLALVQCLWGYRLMRVVFAFDGFLLGAGGGAALSLGPLQGQPTWLQVAVPLVLGVLLAVLLFRLYKLGVFLLAFAVVFVLTWILSSGWQWGALLALGLGITAGIVAVKLVRPAMILSTAFSGGMSAARTVLTALGVTVSLPIHIAGLVISALGAWYQWRSAGTRGE